jgi:uncharacterized protein (TIGR02145 family)
MMLLHSSLLLSQVVINPADNSVILDVNSTDKGLLIPRMTEALRDGITSPAAGLLVYQTDEGEGFYYFDGSSWIYLNVFKGSVTDIDGNAYRTVMIADHEIMAENLRVTKYRNGDPIPNVTDNSEWALTGSGAYCWYNNDWLTNGCIYGALYNWHAVNDSRNLCPTGWYVPSYDDWIAVISSLGEWDAGSGNYWGAGTKMKSASDAWAWVGNQHETDISDFSGLPGGHRANWDGYFSGIWLSGDWWSSTAYDDTQVWTLRLSGPGAFMYYYHNYKGCGYSVRCFKD